MVSLTTLLAALLGFALAAYIVLCLPAWAALCIALGAALLVTIGGGALLAKALVLSALVVMAARSGGVVKDDAGGMPAPGAHAAHAVAQVHAIDAARALHRAVVDREDHRVALARAAPPRRATACAGAARSARTRRR